MVNDLCLSSHVAFLAHYGHTWHARHTAGAQDRLALFEHTQNLAEA